MATRLFVGNLSFAATEDALRDRFAADGRKVVSVRIMLDRETGRSRGFAFVDMASAEDAKAAIVALDGTELEGRSLRVNEATERADRPAGGPSGSRPPRREGGGGSGGAAPRRSFAGGSSGGGGGAPRRFDDPPRGGSAGGRGRDDTRRGERRGVGDERIRDDGGGKRAKRPRIDEDDEDDEDDWE